MVDRYNFVSTIYSSIKRYPNPEEFVSLNVIKLSTFVSVMSVSSTCRTALSKVIVIFESTATDVLLFRTKCQRWW